MVDNTPEVSQAQADILHCLTNNLTITEIAKHRKCSRQAIYKVLWRLLAKGFVEKIGYAYGLTELGKKGLHSFIGFTNKLRQHNINVKMEILESPRNWERKRGVMTSLPYFNKRVKLKNNYYDLFSFGRVRVKTTSKSAIIKIPTIYDDSIEGATIQTMEILEKVIPKIEALFKIKLIKDYKSNITFISQEYARLNDALAKLYKREDNKLYIKDEEGKVWLITDYSFAVNELETIHPIRADEDMKTVHSFLNDLRQNPVTCSQMMGAINSNAEHLNYHATNMRTHVDAVKKLSLGVDKLYSGVDELIKQVKRIGKK